jgi:UDP-3-O-[3-hydroxymyristoyl] glucosamine N-acyltransferase
VLYFSQRRSQDLVVISRNPVTCADIKDRFPQLFLDSVGDLNRTIQRIAAPENADAESALFLGTPKAIAEGLNSKAAVWIINPKARTEAETHRDDRTILIVSNVELAMALVINEFFLHTPYTSAHVQNVHPRAIVHESAELAKDVRIGPGAFVGANVKLARGVFIGANSVIEDETAIDEDTVVHPLVFIGHSTVIGKRCEIHPQCCVGKEGYGYAHDEKFNHTKIPHQGRVVLEDDVHIGGNCTIDRGTFTETRLEKGLRLDNQVHIAHNCRFGRNSLITAGFATAGSTKVGANFVTGGKTVTAGHLEICDNVQIAGVSAVSKNITEPGQYGGNPLMPLQQHLKMKAAMVHLAAMRKQLNSVLRKLGIEET